MYIIWVVIFSVIISIIFLFFTYFMNFSVSNSYYNKTMPFECGFDPLSSQKNLFCMPFSVHFFCVCIIFLLFDVEISLFFSSIMNFYWNKFNSMFVIFFFFIVMSLGFIYEWRKGGMEWE